jgi:nitroimidazol reductase NimA-like FMN-containing flavoprotein (pyridoxamine 5'-phosphate oxidase superfamily)
MLGQLRPQEIEELLARETVARIGCHADGRTYVVPVTYCYEDGSLYAHSRGGLKLEMMRRNPEVCIEVDRVTDLSNWRSVIAWGRFEELHGAAAMSALRKLVQHVMPMIHSETSLPSHAEHPHGLGAGVFDATVFRIVLTEKTGRFERG